MAALLDCGLTGFLYFPPDNPLALIFIFILVFRIVTVLKYLIVIVFPENGDLRGRKWLASIIRIEFVFLDLELFDFELLNNENHIRTDLF